METSVKSDNLDIVKDNLKKFKTRLVLLQEL